MLTEERLIAREGARYWWLFLVSGILWLLIAWMVLRLNATSITTVGVLLGVVFLIAGINAGPLGERRRALGRATSGSETGHGIISTGRNNGGRHEPKR